MTTLVPVAVSPLRQRLIDEMDKHLRELETVPVLVLTPLYAREMEQVGHGFMGGRRELGRKITVSRPISDRPDRGGLYPRQNPVARALREIGRVERTLFMLDWLDDPEQRRRTGSILNKGEPLGRSLSTVAAAIVLIISAGGRPETSMRAGCPC